MVNLLGWILLFAAVVWMVSSICGASPLKSLLIAAVAAVSVIAIFVFILLLHGDT